jgi:hypothetical protein
LAEGPEVRCDPGGMCHSPVTAPLRAATGAAGLSDLTRGAMPSGTEEVRIWTSELDGSGGQLVRVVRDSSGAVVFEEGTWFAEITWGATRPPGMPAPCGQAAAGGRDYEVCVSERLGEPYAANRLRVLSERGVFRFAGSDARPDTACDDVCLPPSWIIVELRSGSRYRTYGYALSASGPWPEAERLLDEY